MLRFTRRWRQFVQGDPAPETFDAGTIDALKMRGVLADDAPATKAVTNPPADKMIRTGKTRKKAVTV